MLRGLYYYLLYVLGFANEWYPWYDVNHVETVKENDICTIYWDYKMQTNNYVKYNKPDILAIYKKEDEILIIEGSCPWDGNLKEKVIEKRNKYIQLAIELKTMYEKSKYTITELVIGATGTVNNSIWKSIKTIAKENCDRTKIMNNCQKATILRTVRICCHIFDVH